jgi:hypothetical protein
MSRQNKVNPGMYTQRGRLTQDDAARELAKQRATGSEHTWQPVQRDQQPWPASKAEGAEDDSEADEPVTTPEKKPAPFDLAQGSPERSRGARVMAKAKPPAKARTKAKTKAKTKAPRVARKAVLARGAGKGSALLAAGRKKKKAAAPKRKR